MSGKKNKKIVRASDASAFNRLRKKLGVEFLADKTDKELQAILDTPDSVFGMEPSSADPFPGSGRRLSCGIRVL